MDKLSKENQNSQENIAAIDAVVNDLWDGRGCPIYLTSDAEFAGFLFRLLERKRRSFTPDQKLIGAGLVMLRRDSAYRVVGTQDLILDCLEADAVPIGFVSVTEDAVDFVDFSVASLHKPDSPVYENSLRLLEIVGEEFVSKYKRVLDAETEYLH
jgi:hypothetical protein